MDGGDIPEWLLTELLIRLPLKLILRSKLVCKHWLSVISNPTFARMLPQSWVLAATLMFYDRSKVPRFPKFEKVENIYSRELKRPSCLLLHIPSSQQPQRDYFKIFGISNGLVLYTRMVIGAEANLNAIYNICNPVMGQWIALPPLTGQFSNAHVGFLTHVKEGTLVSYRVVCLDLPTSGNIVMFHVFFSESGEWKDFSVPSDLEIEVMGERPSDLHGNLHWMLRDKILAYDPDHKPDEFRIITLPGDNEQRDQSLCSASDGKLRYFDFSSGLFETSSSWVLDDYSSGNWSLQHGIDYSDIRYCKFFRGEHLMDPMDTDSMHLRYGNTILSFNIKTSEFRRAAPFFRSRDGTFCSQMYIGQSFLVPPWPTFIPPHFFRFTEN